MTVTEILSDAEDRLLEAMARAARGPDRNGLYALWLVLRVCEDLLSPEPLATAVHLRRLEQLERRLSSLALPPSLRRSIAIGIRTLRTPELETPGLVLEQLVVPTATAIGRAAANTMVLAARAARRGLRRARP